MQEPWLGDHDASLPKIHIGICAMDKKAHSRPMKAIVDRLETYGEFEITYFGDETILEKPIAEWPSCDCLLSWHSDGFPLAKVKNCGRACWTCILSLLLIACLLAEVQCLSERCLLDLTRTYKTPVPSRA